MNKQETKTFPLKLSTVTPIHIGSGEVLSPYSDYIYESRQAHYIDQDKVYKLFGEKPELIDKFVNRVKNDSKKPYYGDKHTISELFKENGLDYTNYVKNSVPVVGSIKSNQINRFVESAGRKYVPGSSLKGAIRTAIVYHILNNDDYKRNLLFGNISKLKKWLDKKELIKVKKTIGSIDDKVLVLKDSDNYMRFLMFRDSDFFDDSDLKIVSCKRFSLKKKSLKSIPLFYETIAENSSVNMGVGLKYGEPPKANFEFLTPEKESVIRLFKIINRFSLECIDAEINSLERFEGVQSFYRELRNQIESSPEAAFLRLGQGKTIYDNTILHLFNEEQFDILYEKMRLKKMKRGAEMTDKNLFPSTRTGISQKNNFNGVIGWIKLELV